MTTQDSAEKRKLESIKAAAKQLPHVIQYIRELYPDTRTTSEIVEALGVSKDEVLAELNSSDRKHRLVGKAHGEINAAVWQYKPTGAETPWKPEYNSL